MGKRRVEVKQRSGDSAAGAVQVLVWMDGWGDG